MANGQQPAPQPEPEPTPEQSFRISLDDTIAILEGIGPQCTDLDQLIDMLKLALTNDGQLNLLFKHMTPPRIRR